MIGTPRQGHDDAPDGRRVTAGVDSSHDGRSATDERQQTLAFESGDEDGWHQLARGYRLAGLLLSAHRMGLLQALSDGEPHDVDDLSQQLVADPRMLADP
ncbi:MAG TPA: hypothetical protein VK923_00930 [Euzebyales bacterium]|nr:hypothetical protein [Euzebyales bacterium]